MGQANNRYSDYDVLVAVRDVSDLPLIAFACHLARAYDGGVCVFTVSMANAHPAWLKLPDACADVPIEIVVRADKDISQAILREVHRRGTDLLVLGWEGRRSQDGHVLGETLDPVVQKATCNVILMRGQCAAQIRRVLIPARGGPHTPEGLMVARKLAPDAEITALYVAAEELGPTEIIAGETRLETMLRRLSPADREHTHPYVIQAASPTEGILREATAGYDLLIIGAGRENVVGRFLFGNIPQTVAAGSPIPVMIVRRHLTQLTSFSRRLWTFLFGLVPSLTLQERAEISQHIRHGSHTSTDFLVMITLAAALAALGLLLNSPAVIIGAMLVDPLMRPIVGMGLALVIGDLRFFRTALGTASRGMVLALITGLIIGALIPGASATAEILNRASPSVLDLVIALASGAIAAYALCRHDVTEALAGVAIALSLTPPLATVGIGVILGQHKIAGGALLLFFTNMIAIVAASSLAFFLFAFRPVPGDTSRARVLRRGFQGVAALLLVVTVFLVILTRQSVIELRLRQEITAALQHQVNDVAGGELLDWKILEIGDDGTLYMDVTIRAAHSFAYTEARSLQEHVAEQLHRPVALSLAVVPATRLQAYVPPTPTAIPPSTPMGLPTETPTPTPTAIPTIPPSPTPTPSPMATATPTPTSTVTPTPSATPTATPWIMYVTNVGRTGLRVHYSPDGMVMGHIAEGTAVIVADGPLVVGETTWYHVISTADHLEGWVAAAYLVPNNQ